MSDAEVATNSDRDPVETNAVAPPKWKDSGLPSVGCARCDRPRHDIGRIVVVQQPRKEVGHDTDTDAIAGTNRRQNEGAGLIRLGAGALAFNAPRSAPGPPAAPCTAAGPRTTPRSATAGGPFSRTAPSGPRAGS